MSTVADRRRTRLIGIPVSAQVQQDAASLQPSALPPSTRTWGDNTPGQQVFALDALKDEVAHLLLAKPHTTELLLVPHERRSAGEPGEGADAEAARHYVNKAVLGIVFDHAEEATDACPCDKLGHWRWQRITPMFARCVPQKAKRTPVRSKHMGKVKAGADTGADVPVPLCSCARRRVARGAGRPDGEHGNGGAGNGGAVRATG
ncbi:hypothetical protein POSPLADRAFT_1056487 [Postia placenta MAD-698-R-SB12]|uniref:Uncharacterized protein n=1 Tax=Postia placenta MAD-698-R-SB12 TaxID=670580 RepID=A0A1X6N3C6_9APHY|nr:hypothetical protein POSPLADRAFT_1056487 [Postia placenta MAD-698-R-SB12]OSX63127.1 hypothetical protein POSPLADRAFT_1056487 [Postia placenta MAD-698-R-SB12]